jgi:uncharacterized protein with GYD domain
MKEKIIKILSSATLIALWAPVALAKVECATGTMPQDLADILDTIRNFLVGLGIAVAAIFITLGGYTFITAAGDPGKAETGRRQIMYAFIGVVIILIAMVIVRIAQAVFCQ